MASLLAVFTFFALQFLMMHRFHLTEVFGSLASGAAGVHNKPFFLDSEFVERSGFLMNIHTLFNPKSSRLKRAGAPIKHYLQQQSWVLAIGNFDGVHRGHQVLLQRLSEQAVALKSLQAVMVFEPQPLEHFNTVTAPMRIMGVRDKIEALFCAGIDLVLLCSFDEKLLQMSPDSFMARLREHLNLKGLVLGRDFKFGYQRQGDMAYLQAYGLEHDIQVYAMPDFKDDNIRVSSSLIRRYIREDRFEEACSSLGRPFLLTGKIKHGMKLARGLGFPTANLHVVRRNPPINGVFVGRAYLPYNDPSDIGGAWLKAVANAGLKPTVNGAQWQIEVHIFDETLSGDTIESNKMLKGDCHYYGLRLAFEPLARLRDEKCFSNLVELKTAITEDVSQAKAYFENV